MFVCVCVWQNYEENAKKIKNKKRKKKRKEKHKIQFEVTQE